MHLCNAHTTMQQRFRILLFSDRNLWSKRQTKCFNNSVTIVTTDIIHSLIYTKASSFTVLMRDAPCTQSMNHQQTRCPLINLIFSYFPRYLPSPRDSNIFDRNNWRIDQVHVDNIVQHRRRLYGQSTSSDARRKTSFEKYEFTPSIQVWSATKPRCPPWQQLMIQVQLLNAWYTKLTATIK
jgi:hypothetical protein